MTTPADGPHLPDVEYRRMSLILRIGLSTSLVLLIGGLLVYLVQHPHLGFDQALAHNPILQYLGFTGLVDGLAAGNMAAVLTLGLLALVATPILRVMTGFYYFRHGGERTMAQVTLTVLILLLFGILVLGPILR